MLEIVDSQLLSVRVFSPHGANLWAERPTRDARMEETQAKFKAAADGAYEAYRGLKEQAAGLFPITALGAKRVLKGHVKKVTCLAWKDHDGPPTLAGADQNHKVILWDAKTAMKKQIYSSSFVMAVDVHPTRDLVIIGTMQNVCAIVDMAPSLSEGNKTRDLLGHDGYIGSVKFIEQGTKVVSAGGDAEVKLWDAERGQEIATLYGHQADAGSISFPAAGTSEQVFCTGSVDKTVKMWDLRQRACAMTFEAEGEINCVSMFPDGNAVVAGCETCNRSAVEGTAKEEWEDTTGAATFFDIRSGAIISKFTRRKQKCTNVQWSRSGRILFISYEDGNVGMWDPWTQGGIKHKIPAHLNPNPKESVVSAMVMSPDGAVLATGGFDSLIKIWGAGG